MKTKKDTTCFAPFCKSGYKSSRKGLKVSLFSAPRDPELFKRWELALHRADKRLQPHSVVCERHFDQECIERDYKYMIEGNVVSSHVLTHD